jgi:hypothetical protein
MEKQNTVHPHNGIIYSHEKNDVVTPAAMWTNLDNMKLSDRSQK